MKRTRPTPRTTRTSTWGREGDREQRESGGKTHMLQREGERGRERESKQASKREREREHERARGR
eukprot:845030-Rhodomonas_salina.1